MTRRASTASSATVVTARRSTTRVATLVATLLAALALVTTRAAQAQDWPRGTTRIVAPFAPGSTPDLVARLLADRLQKNLGQAFVVENRPGAGGMVGTALVARAQPDGATIGVSIGGPLVNNTVLYRSMTYDPFRDLAPVTRVVDQPCVLVASSKLEATTARALTAELARRGDVVNYASLGNGTVSHLVMAEIASRAHAPLSQVPYPGSAQAVAALLAGDVALGCLPASNVMPQVRSGALKLLGIASRARSPLFPGVATLIEQGLADVEANAWIGVVAPARTPASTVARMQAEMAKVLHDPDVARTLAAQYMEPVGDSPQAFAIFLQGELDRWGPVIRENRITLD